jgi:hypothetical protein
LLLAISVILTVPNHFIDGFDLEQHIVSYLSHLWQFNFHIRSILKNARHVEINTIRQSFKKQKEHSFDCVLDYFNNNFDQCQIYSLPFIGVRLDFISNRFPLIDNNILLAIIDQDHRQSKDNCSRVKRLQTVKPANDSVDVSRKFFLPDAYVKHPDQK